MKAPTLTRRAFIAGSATAATIPAVAASKPSASSRAKDRFRRLVGAWHSAVEHATNLYREYERTCPPDRSYAEHAAWDLRTGAAFSAQWKAHQAVVDAILPPPAFRREMLTDAMGDTIRFPAKIVDGTVYTVAYDHDQPTDSRLVIVRLADAITFNA